MKNIDLGGIKPNILKKSNSFQCIFQFYVILNLKKLDQK